MLSTNSCDLQKMKFGCLVTYAQACETLAAVENWLAPLRKLMPMLGCFTANASILFSSYMEREMQQIEKLSATKGLDFKDPQKEDAEISVAVPLDVSQNDERLIVCKLFLSRADVQESTQRGQKIFEASTKERRKLQKCFYTRT